MKRLLTAALAVCMMLTGCTETEPPLVTIGATSTAQVAHPSDGRRYLEERGVHFKDQQSFELSTQIVCEGFENGAHQVGISQTIQESLSNKPMTTAQADTVMRTMVAYGCPDVRLYDEVPGYTLNVKDEVGARILLSEGMDMEPELFGRVARRMCVVSRASDRDFDAMDAVMGMVSVSQDEARVIMFASRAQYCPGL